MDKTKMMKRYEKETGEKPRKKVLVMYSTKKYGWGRERNSFFFTNKFVEWLLSQLDKYQAKAEAYDRIMSGGQKTPKEIANIFGFPIAMDCYSSNHEFQHGSDWNWFTTKPFIDGENDCWTIKRGQWGRVPYGLLNGYDGEWQESLTFPDRQIGSHR